MVFFVNFMVDFFDHGNFTTLNVNFSRTRRAMDAFESALESPDIILFDENIFTLIEYSLINLQMKM